MIHQVSHVEWFVTDLARAEAFFTALLGWRFEAFSRHYRLYTPEQGPCVGLMEVETVYGGRSPMVYIQVADLDALLERAVELGAVVATARREIPDYGSYAQLRDPDGNLLGLFQQG
ncbi:MAG: VOC family protein [Candidatus Competibacteraceae bacterium]|nr:VOC family protein [Candidatus Competibacteraceae bacterium]